MPNSNVGHLLRIFWGVSAMKGIFFFTNISLNFEWSSASLLPWLWFATPNPQRLWCVPDMCYEVTEIVKSQSLTTHRNQNQTIVKNQAGVFESHRWTLGVPSTFQQTTHKDRFSAEIHEICFFGWGTVSQWRITYDKPFLMVEGCGAFS